MNKHGRPKRPAALKIKLNVIVANDFITLMNEVPGIAFQITMIKICIQVFPTDIHFDSARKIKRSPWKFQSKFFFLLLMIYLIIIIV